MSLIASALRNEILATRVWTGSDPVMRERYGFALRWRAGVACFTARRPLFGGTLAFGHKAIGLGTLVPATQRALDEVLRAYDGTACRILVPDGAAPPPLISLLERNGFAPEDRAFDWHVLLTHRAPRVEVDGVRVERLAAAEGRRYARISALGFGYAGHARPYFARVLPAIVRRRGTAAAFVAVAGGRDAASGIALFSDDAVALFSGSVSPRFRGRGIQKAVIAARVALGVARGRRIFLSQTDADTPSAHNLHDLGFRRRWRIAHWSRDLR